MGVLRRLLVALAGGRLIDPRLISYFVHTYEVGTDSLIDLSTTPRVGTKEPAPYTSTTFRYLLRTQRRANHGMWRPDIAQPPMVAYSGF